MLNRRKFQRMSDTLCNYPFRHLYVETNGHQKLCCMPNEFIEKNDGYRHFKMTDGLVSGWNSDYMKQVRINMLKGNKVSACKKCYTLEANGQQSLRMAAGQINETVQQKYISKCAPDGTMETMPDDIELHFGNVCNLKCRMCSHKFSHSIGKELLEIKKDDPTFFQWIQKQGGNVNNWSTGDLSEKYEWFKDKNVLKKVFEDIHNHVKSLRIIGGEPTVIPEFWELFEYLSSRGSLKDKKINITTNGTNTNPKMLRWFKEAGKIEIMFSLDALGPRNRYIRYPSDWDTLMRNLDIYKKISESNTNSIRYFIAVTPQILNVDQLTELCLHFEKVGHYVDINPDVVSPRILDFNYFPLEYKKKVIEKLQTGLDKVKSKKNVSRIQSIINTLKTDFDHKEIERNSKDFVKYNDFLDKFRKTDSWRELLPDLEKILDKKL